jgi:hypothetical protein
MKRTALVVLLITLLLFEVFLCTGFLPFEWQGAIDRTLPKMHGDQTSITHPSLHREIEEALREDIRLRLGLYMVIVLLLIIKHAADSPSLAPATRAGTR